MMQSEELLLKTITGAAQDAILMMNPEGKISFVNPAAVKMFGFAREEMIGQNLHNLLAPKEFHPAHLPAYKHFLVSGEGNAIGKIVELKALKKDGTQYIYRAFTFRLEFRRWLACGRNHPGYHRKKEN